MTGLSTTPLELQTFDPAFATEVTNKIAQLVGAPNEVLLIGGSASLGDTLRARGWQVVWVTDDPEETTAGATSWAGTSGQDHVEWLSRFGARRFQAIVIVGLLEFVRDPAAALRALRELLASQGQIVALVPNVAHGDLRLALLSGHFPYADWDQPERMPLRFYTRETVEALFTASGFEIGNLERHSANIGSPESFGQLATVSTELIESLTKAPEAQTSHFVILARPTVREQDDASHPDDTVQILAQSRLEARIDQQVVQLEAVAAQVALLGQRVEDRLLDEPRPRVTSADRSVLGPLRATESALAQLSLTASAWWKNRRVSEARQVMQYHRLIHRVRGIVRAALPQGATVLVVSRGDDALLAFDDRRGWHFPMHGDGSYAGHHPGDSAEAIGHLEDLRARGAEFLLIPRTACWWLDYYTDFAQHLERGYRVVVQGDDFGVIYGLQED